ncbi:MAG TPA: ATP-binding protein [Marmoricola sp.]|nr:ATP-binding protein [Marmoricola sp.]
MERTGAPTPTARVAAWADDAFARLSTRPGVHRVGLALVEGGGRRLRFTASDRDGAGTDWCHVDAYDDVPLNAAVRSGTPVVGTVEDLAASYPQFIDRQRGTPTVAVAAVPLVTGGRVLGGFVLYYDGGPALDPSHRRELARLGRALGVRLRNAQRGRRRPTPTGSDETPPDALVAVHEVDGDPAAVAGARRFLRGTLRAWDVSVSAADAAVLCLSELVTNALIHGNDGCVVRVVLHEGVVRVDVRDTGAGAAEVGSPTDPLQVHGRGLQVVEALATRWGHEVDDGGLSVWFEIADN